MFAAGFLSGAMAYGLTTPMYGIKNRLIGEVPYTINPNPNKTVTQTLTQYIEPSTL